MGPRERNQCMHECVCIYQQSVCVCPPCLINSVAPEDFFFYYSHYTHSTTFIIIIFIPCFLNPSPTFLLLGLGSCSCSDDSSCRVTVDLLSVFPHMESTSCILAVIPAAVHRRSVRTRVSCDALMKRRLNETRHNL